MQVLIASVDLGCAEEILTILAMLAAENIWFRPKEKQAQADQRKAQFHQPEGDHITYLAVYEAWKRNNFNTQWCNANFINARSMKRAQVSHSSAGISSISSAGIYHSSFGMCWCYCDWQLCLHPACLRSAFLSWCNAAGARGSL
jgi:HrpA-like RNA helicase